MGLSSLTGFMHIEALCVVFMLNFQIVINLNCDQLIATQNAIFPCDRNKEVYQINLMGANYYCIAISHTQTQITINNSVGKQSIESPK